MKWQMKMQRDVELEQGLGGVSWEEGRDGLLCYLDRVQPMTER